VLAVDGGIEVPNLDLGLADLAPADTAPAELAREEASP
jgi:hypothetical protein